MDRISLDVAGTTNELDLDDHQVVDVFKVISNTVFSVDGITSADDQVSSSPLRDLTSDMTSEMEVPISPLDK